MKRTSTSMPMRLIITCIVIFVECIASSNVLMAQDTHYVPPIWNFESDQIALSVEGLILIYDANTGALNQLNRSGEGIYAFAWSSDSNLLAASYGNGNVEIWNADNGVRVRGLELENPANVIAWVPNNLQLLSIGGDISQNLNVWDVSSGMHLGSYRGGAALNVEFDPTGRYLALHTSLSLYILDAQNYTVVVSSPRVMCCTNQMSTLAWSQDGNYIVTGSINGLVTVWDATALIPLRQFPANPYYMQDSRDVPDLALSQVHDVDWIGSEITQTVSGDGTVRQWDANGRLLQETQLGHLETASWSPYGARLVLQTLSTLAASSTQTDTISLSADRPQIITPFASPERLQAIAEMCDTPLTIERQLDTAIAAEDMTSLIAQVEALPTGTIPPACAADLIAVAEAIQAQ